MSLGGFSTAGALELKYKLDATAAPTVNDDITLEYQPGSHWVDLTNDTSYICVDNTDGAAVWRQTGGSGSVGIANVIEDTTPQLGGNLDVNGFNVGGVTPTELGYVAGVTSDVQTQLGTKLANVVEDTTPTLGGPLSVGLHHLIDANGNEILLFSATGSAVNYLSLKNSATGNAPQLIAEGTDTNVSLRLVPQGAGSIEIPVIQNAQTGTSYTLVLSDYGKLITMSNASANTLLIPANASVAFPVGTRIEVVMLGAGVTSIDGDTGVTLNGVSGGIGAINTRYQGVCLTKIATDTWLASGDIGIVA